MEATAVAPRVEQSPQRAPEVKPAPSAANNGESQKVSEALKGVGEEHGSRVALQALAKEPATEDMRAMAEAIGEENKKIDDQFNQANDVTTTEISTAVSESTNEASESVELQKQFKELAEKITEARSLSDDTLAQARLLKAMNHVSKTSHVFTKSFRRVAATVGTMAVVSVAAQIADVSPEVQAAISAAFTVAGGVMAGESLHPVSRVTEKIAKDQLSKKLYEDLAEGDLTEATLVNLFQTPEYQVDVSGEALANLVQKGETIGVDEASSESENPYIHMYNKWTEAYTANHPLIGKNELDTRAFQTAKEVMGKRFLEAGIKAQQERGSTSAILQEFGIRVGDIGVGIVGGDLMSRVGEAVISANPVGRAVVGGLDDAAGTMVGPIARVARTVIGKVAQVIGEGGVG
jgi:hypothetical protein